ncbi:MAG: bifunctional phosphopantothenoylcysteine decarboxylase/phosphopantothenate--cysteine ligase CoaBC [Verrucomicrobiota bacterium]
MAALQGKRILLVVTGSIAAYKALELVRLLTKAGAAVETILTKAGAEFVTPLSFEALTGRKAFLEMWDSQAQEMSHIELSRRNDMIVVAPASADFAAKMALGLGDDLASTVVLAGNKPILIAPSMNVEMWENPAFRRNLDRVQADGTTVVPPQEDRLVCGETGIGKMAEPSTIFDAIEDSFSASTPLSGKTAIVTTGGTIERIDSVRYLSNFSSGKQGNAIALALAKAGAQVTLASGNTSEPDPLHPNIRIHQVESAEEMKAATHGALPADIFVGAAAVCDFKIANKADKKIKKEDGLELQLEENPDIARSIGTLDKSQRPSVVVGFAAETDDLIAHAQKKLVSKNCDLIVANDVSQGAVFGQNENTIHFVTADETQSFETMSKRKAAQEIVAWIIARLAPAES